MLAGLEEGARPSDLEGRAASPVLVGLAEGSLSSSLEGGTVFPMLVLLAEGYQHSGYIRWKGSFSFVCWLTRGVPHWILAG